MSASEAKLATTPPVHGSAITTTNGTRASFEQVDGAGGLGHLHERDGALLHARAAGAGDADQRHVLGGGGLAGAPEPLADDAAHAAAHEEEVHDGEHAGHLADASPVPPTIASVRPLVACASRTRSGYGMRSLKLSGSSVRRWLQRSTNEPGSASCAMRSRAPMRRWSPQSGHTERLALTTAGSSSWPHLGQVQRMGTGPASRRAISTVTAISLEAPEDQRHVVAAEAERVASGDAHVGLARLERARSRGRTRGRAR